MQTREIPQSEWVAFFDSFSLANQGRPVSIRVTGLDVGLREEVQGLPFSGISADVKDGESAISIIAGQSSDSHTTRTINMPVHVRVREGAGGGDEIEIESAVGRTTIIRFLG